jgi:hypothetical protein
MRARAAIAVAVAVLAACSSRSGGGDAPVKGPEADDAALAAMRDRLAADRPKHARAALAQPGVAAPAIEDAYDKARRVAVGLLAPNAHTADAVFAAVQSWSGAPKGLRAIGEDPRAGEVAALIAAGAAGDQGAVPGNDAAALEGTGAVAVAHAMHTLEGGDATAAAWRLLAAAHYGYDIARGRPQREGDHGLSLVRAAAAGVRVAAPDLPPDARASLHEGCRTLIAAHPSFADVWWWDTRWREQRALAVFDPGKDDAPIADAIAAEVRARADRAGGVAAFAKAFAAQRDAIERLRTMTGATAEQREAFVRNTRTELWGPQPKYHEAGDIHVWERTQRELAETCTTLGAAP